MYSSDMTDPPEAQASEPAKMSVSRKMAMAAWDALKGADDPAAEKLPEDTMMRLELFALEIRNATIEGLSVAMERYLNRMTEEGIKSLRSLKDK